jgi:hypothetical protein
MACDNLRDPLHHDADADAEAEREPDDDSGTDADDAESATSADHDGSAGAGGGRSDAGASAAADGASGGEPPAALVVANVPPDAALKADGDLIFNTAACNATPEIDTVAGKLNGCNPDKGSMSFSLTSITQPDTSLGTLSAALLVTRRFVIEQGMRVTVVGNRPLIVVALQEAVINGQLQASALGYEARGGGFGVTESGQNGLGPGGGGKPNGRSGAGGAGFCGRGGASGTVQGLSALGGKSYGNPENVPLIGGSSGGMWEWHGSAGGGAIQISAGQRIDVGLQGVIHVGGGGTGFTANGGGSGGAILLAAPSVRVLGHLAANGGGGSSPASADGASGADAANDDQPALGGRVPNLPFGGDGSAGTRIDGTAGGNPADENGLGAGGGGGAGRIRINVKEGEPELTGAVISPSRDTPCFTLGKLK